MGIQGRLTKENMAAIMPVTAPAYKEEPINYVDSHAWIFEFETDENVAADLLPKELSLDDPPIGSLAFMDYRKTTLGPYRETGLGLNVLYKGEPVKYILYLFLDQETPTLAGREIWGFAKKMADIQFYQQEDILFMYAERPKGVRICSAEFRDSMTNVQEMPEEFISPGITLRAIPSPEKDHKFSLLQLVRVDTVLLRGRISIGEGSIHFPSKSIFDPWHILPIKRMLSCSYSNYEGATLPHGQILEDLL